MNLEFRESRELASPSNEDEAFQHQDDLAETNFESGEEYDYEDDDYEDDDYEDDDYEDDDYEDDDYEDDNHEYGYDDEYDSQDSRSEYYRGNERTDVKEEYLSFTEIDIPKQILDRYEFISELPDSIAVIGGVARSIAREIIAGDREPIRDIDLVNIVDETGVSKISWEVLDDLSKKYMPDDYSYGHGINNETLDEYFKTRDFTINQTIILDKKLIVSDVAYDDFQENIIRPTYFELPYDGYKLDSRLFLKALMMRSVLSQISNSIPLLEEVSPPNYISPFNIALFLNKTMSRDVKTACVFSEDLADWGVVGDEYANRPMALAKMLLEDVYSFEFRSSKDKRFIDLLDCRDMDGFFIPKAMKTYFARDSIVRDAMSEYEDGSSVVNRKKTDNYEKQSGYYSQADFDAINSTEDYDWRQTINQGFK